MPDVQVEVAPDTLEALRRCGTGTLSSQLSGRGIDNTFIEGLHPTRPDLRMVGFAVTLRDTAPRQDVLAERREAGLNAQRQAIEQLGPGDVLVIEARGELGSGTIGDILALRALRRGAAGIVSDGGLRDAAAFAGLDLPSYAAAPHAATLWRRHVPMDVGLPVTCGGVLVMPGDVLVGDADGVIVIPRKLTAEVARDALEQERQERFIHQRVDAGAPVEGLFPLGPAWRAEYDAWTAREDSPD